MLRVGSGGCGGRLNALVDAAAEAELLVQSPPTNLESRAARSGEVRCRESAEHVRMPVDVGLVGAGGDGEAGVRVEDQSALDQQDVVALGSPRSPGDPRVLHDHAAGEVSELAEVRVVDLEVIRPVCAHVPVRLDSCPADVEVVGVVGSVRRSVLVELELRLDERLDVERHILGG